MRKILTMTLTIACLAGAAPVTGQQVQLKVATIAPEGSTWVNEARRGADEVARRTDNRVTFRFYPGGTMGSDQALLRKMRIGQLQGGAVLSGSLATVDTGAELYTLPLLFRDYAEVDLVRGRFDREVTGRIEDDGFVVLGFVETGFVYLMSTKPAKSFDDLKGRKIWMPEGDRISKAIVDAAGLSPVPLSVADVMTGLQTGLVDTVAAPPVAAVALQGFTKANFVTDLPITYVYGALLISQKAFDRIKPEDQAVVREVMGQVTSRLDGKARDDNAGARVALEKQGVTFVGPTDETVRRWREIAAEATRSLMENQSYDASLVARINQALADHRKGQPDGGSGP
jgi:TRAP-type C4-dicarboxylate transport system substrate-binding protein